MLQLATRTLAALMLAAAFVAATAQERPRDPIGAPAPALPEFIRQALVTPNAQKANFVVSPTGRISKSSVHVVREGLPSWVHGMADQTMGKGEDLAYEIEVYPDGSEVFEIYRKVQGQERQLSVRADDKKVYYLGTELKENEVPPAVADTLAKMKDFHAEKRIRKEGPSFYEIHVKGDRNGVPTRLRIARDGTLLSAEKKVPAEIEIAAD